MASQPLTSTNSTKLGLAQRLRRWSRPPRRLTFTRAGKFFMLMTLLIGGGALNTGNNLLFLMLGMMISTIVASGIASEAVLRKLKLKRRPPGRIYARQEAVGKFVVDNPRSYPSLNIEAIERRSHCTEGPFAQERVGGKDVPWWKFWVTDLFDDHHYLAIARLPEVPANGETEATASYRFPHRGSYHSYGLRLATRFPFGLFHKVSDLEDPHDFLVYPTPLTAHEWVTEVASRFGDSPRRRAGLGEEYFGLRNWRTGEDQRAISWKRSAKRDTFVVRESEEQEKRALELVLVNQWPKLGRPISLTDQHRYREMFELGLGKLTALLDHLTKLDYRIGLRTLDGVISQGEGAVHLDRLLSHLATLQIHAPAASKVLLPPTDGAQSAKVGLGFTQALEQTGLGFDLVLNFDDLEADQ